MTDKWIPAFAGMTKNCIIKFMEEFKKYLRYKSDKTLKMPIALMWCLFIFVFCYWVFTREYIGLALIILGAAFYGPLSWKMYKQKK